MPKTEEGEYELVLGNRQLLSVFFIVVILFGVFFTMGYIVGRNSAPSTMSGLTASRAEVPPPKPEARVAAPLAAETKPEITKPAESTEPKVETPITTQPVRQSDEIQPEEIKPAEPAENKRSAAATESGGGLIYLQVAAVSRQDADVIVDALRRKGFPALIGAGPSPMIFRVFVGPFHDMATVAKTKAELESAGFKNPIVRR